MFKPLLNSLFVFITLLFSIILFADNEKKEYSYKQLNHLIEENTDENKQLILLKQYIVKAKQEGNVDELIEAYRKTIFKVSEKDAVKYCDSLIQAATSTQDDLTIAIGYQTIATYFYTKKDFRESLNASLLAENHILKTNDLYALYKIRNSIGRIKYHIGETQEALDLYLEAKKYYETRDDFNSLQGQLNSLFFISKCYIDLQQWNLGLNYVNEGIRLIDKLSYDELKSNWIGYFSYLEGIHAYNNTNYALALEKLSNSISLLEEKEDDINLNTVYLYLGKVHWDKNKREDAIPYFLKINDLFENKKQINNTLREAYLLIIQYYEDEKNLELQLKYTNQLIKVDNYLNGEYRILSNRLRTDFDLRKLIDTKAKLEKEISANKNQNLFWLIGTITLALMLLGGYLWSTKSKKNTHKTTLSAELVVDPILSDIDIKKGNTLEEPQTESLNISDNVIEDILQKLKVFEQKKLFIKTTISQKTLAEEWDTNTSYLSKIVNKYKQKNFKQYLNDLRIDYAIETLSSTNTHMRSYKIDALAEEFGFSNARSFTDAFYIRTGQKLSSFLKQKK